MAHEDEQDEQDEQDDAARAFEDLAAEVRVMRRAVEALEAKKPVDYAPTLAALTQELERLTGVTAAMANRPAMVLTPERYAAQIGRAADEAARPAAAELQRVQTLTATLERALGGIKTREEQRRWVVRAAIGGMAVGVFVWALLLIPMARLLPDSWHLPEKLAAGVVGTNRWTAGESMMARPRGQSLTRCFVVDSTLPFGGGVGRADRGCGRGVGADRAVAAARARAGLPTSG